MESRFITFGSHDNYIDAAKRLIKQARRLKLFTHSKYYTQKDLQEDTTFWKKHHNFIMNNPRGYGYWLWKPYLIKKNIKDMKDGSILLYSDCGCEIVPYAKKKLSDLFIIAQEDKIIGSYTCIEKDWNKMDLILHLGMNADPNIYLRQHQAGMLLIYVCKETRALVNKWYSLAHADNYHYLDDSPSITPNLPGFREHRHDQSILSLLTKKTGLFSKHSLAKIILPLRNKSGISKLNK